MDCDPRSALNSPVAYLSLMTWLGADQGMRRIVDQVLRPQPGERVLDLGCGPGRLRPFLPGVVYVGLDENESYLAHARSRYPHDHFECFDLEGDAPFSDRNFDLMVAFGLLHHLPDPAAASLLAFCHERLCPGGRLVTLDCVHQSGQRLIAKLLIALDRGRFVRDASGYANLARREFADVEVRLYDDLLRVPYAHVVLECRK